MKNDICQSSVLEGLKKIKSGKTVCTQGELMFTKGLKHTTCWDKTSVGGLQLFIIENSQIDNLILELESKTFGQNL